jgi:hypothetical protein
MRTIAGAVIALGVIWVTFVVALAILRLHDLDLREARRLLPDVIRLLRDLHRDRALPAGVRRWLRALLVYLMAIHHEHARQAPTGC